MSKNTPKFKNFLFILYCLIPTVSWSQTTPILHFYNSNWQLVNPAAVDKAFIFNEHRSQTLQGTYRQQWIGIAGSPTFSLLSYEHLPSQKKADTHRVKWGLNILRDQTDALSNNGVYGNFAYYFPIKRDQYLHIGTTTGIVWHQLDIAKLNFSNPTNDITAINFNYLDVNIGIFYRHKTKFYAGIAIPQTISLAVNNHFDIASTLNEQRFYNLIIGGFTPLDGQRINKSQLILEPALWIRYAPEFKFQTLYANAPISLDFNLRFHYQQHLWFGTGLGTNQLVNMEFGWNKSIGGENWNTYKHFIKVALNWQIPIGGIRGFDGQGLEVKIAYAWE